MCVNGNNSPKGEDPNKVLSGNGKVEVIVLDRKIWLEFNYQFVDVTPLFTEWAHRVLSDKTAFLSSEVSREL